MFSSTIRSPALLRLSTTALVLFRRVLMVAGIVFLLGLAGFFSGNTGLLLSLQALLPADVSASEVVEGDPVGGIADSADSETAVAPPAADALNPQMRRALDSVSRRYRVAHEALEPIFATAQSVGRELRLDPLLIIAVIGVESGFNPFSQSVVGAQGLMQVVPRFHLDKVPEKAGDQAFLDPVTNVLIGARVLKESIRRSGGLEEGLQQFGGALNDPERRYSNKVLAEHQRLGGSAVRRLAPAVQLADNQEASGEQ